MNAFRTVLAACVLVGAVSSVAAGKTPAPASRKKPVLSVRSWTGDYDGMVKRRVIRILTPYSKTQYFIDKGVPRGIVQDAAVMLEKTLNKKLKTTNANKLVVVVVPTSRDALYESLVKGRGDIIAAGVTVTPERQKLVDFTIATKRNVSEIVVTGPGAPPLAAVGDLAGREVAVRAGSIQFESLQTLNENLKQRGKTPVRIRTVPSSLEDEDILEMANAGLLKTVVVDDVYADFWKQILPGITPHPEIAIRADGDMAWAVRKNSPKLLAALNPIVKANGEGTLFGNQVLRKYLKDTAVVKNATAPEEIQKFNQLVAIFRKYAGQYSVDYLLMMAQGYQESRLDQGAKSHVGAIGIMQVMPATGKELNVGDITKIDANIQAGVKYMRFMIDEHFAGEPMDDMNKLLFAFASYNAGPGRIDRLRKQTKARGLNPNLWFNNVERIVAEKIGGETVTYVSSIYKYYVAYSLTVEAMEATAKSRRP
jgi:membrane-bound lytic murein transglycosylase MltF